MNRRTSRPRLARRHRRFWSVERLEDRTLLSYPVGGLSIAPASRLLSPGPDGITHASGTLTSLGQVDVYSLVAPSSGLYSIEELAPTGSNLDSSVSISDAQGHQLSTVTGAGPGADSVIRINLIGGQSYQIGAGGDLSNTVNTGAYVLVVSPYDRSPGLAAGTTIGANIEQEGQIDSFRFVPRVSGMYAISEGASAGSSLNPFLTVLDAGGIVLSRNRDNAGNFNKPFDATIDLQLIALQTYYLDAAGAHRDSTGAFNLSIKPFSAATPIPFHAGVATFSGDVAQTGSLVLFQFQAPSTGLMAVRRYTTLANDALDSHLLVYDATGAALAVDDSTKGGIDSLTQFTATIGQTYVVETSLTTAQRDGPYQFEVSSDDFGDTTNVPFNLTLVGNQVTTQAGSTEAPGDTDAFAFVASQTGPLIVRVDPSPKSGLDPLLSVQDSNGNAPASAFNGVQDTANQVVIQAKAGQMYDGLVSGNNGTTGAYRFSLTPADFGSDFASATLLPISGSPTLQVGTIMNAGEANYFTFVAPTTGTVGVELDAPSTGFAPRVSAFDGSQRPVAVGGPVRSSTGSASRATFDLIAGQSYFLEVASASDVNATGAYSLAVTIAGRAVGPHNTPANADPVVPGTTTSAFTTPGRVEVFQVMTMADGRLQVGVAAGQARTRLTLLDAQGNRLLQADSASSATGGGNALDLHVAHGTYNLEILGISGSGPDSISVALTPATTPGQTLSVGSGYMNPIALGDFNGDGIPDLVDLNGVHLGLGDGTFGSTIPTQLSPYYDAYAIEPGHFTGSGKLDLAVLDYSTNDVTIFLGNGDGTFRTGGRYPVGASPMAIAVGDFTGNGKVDLAVADSGSNDVSILLGNGDGTFRPATRYAVGASPSAIVAGNFGSDGHFDLAVSDSSSNDVAILLGNGDGTFRNGVRNAVGSSPSGIVAGDFNHDGQVDLAVANSGSDDVTILIGAGDGGFRTAGRLAAGSGPSAILAGAFDGSDQVSLAVVNQVSNDVSVFRGLGDGTFRPQVRTTVGNTPTGLVAGDFNHDGLLDVATTNNGSTDVSVLFGLGDGSFRVAGSNQTVGYPQALVSGDFNRDGQVDLIAANNGNTLSVSLGGGAGTLEKLPPIPTRYDPRSVVTGDFNGDGRLDLAVGEYDAAHSSGMVEIFLGYGDGTFQAGQVIKVGGIPDALVVRDFNGDGRLDIAATADFLNYVSTLLGNGDGTFKPPTTETVEASPDGIVAGDFNGDGKIDLAVANHDSQSVSVLLGNGDGTFQKQITTIVGYCPVSLTSGDFNGDGHLDVAVLNAYPGTTPDDATILLGDGTGHFLTSQTLLINQGAGGGRILAADLLGYGNLDLAISDGSTNLTLYQGDGHGRFRLFEQLAVGQLPQDIVAVSLSGGARPDLITANQNSNDLTVLLNQGSGNFVPIGSAVLSVLKRSLPVFADFGLGAAKGVLVINRPGEILWRSVHPQEANSFNPPVVVNPGIPSQDVTVVILADGRELVASVDSRDNGISLFAYDNGGFVLLGRLPTGLLPRQILAANLDGGGCIDLIVRNAGDGTATVYLGDGQGQFTRQPAVAIGVGASSLALAVLDGSGRPDLIVTDATTGTVTVVPNLGQGRFGSPDRTITGVGPYSLDASANLSSLDGTAGVASGTFHVGGPTDLAVINPGSDTLAVLSGLGDGTFSAPRFFRTLGQARAVVVGDFANNTRSDVAILAAGGVSVYLGNGRGGFLAPTLFDAGPDPTGLTVSDVNLDGNPDLLVGNDFGDVLVLLGNGDGTFRSFQKTDRKISLAVAGSSIRGEQSFVFANQGLDQVSVKTGAGGPLPISGSAQGVRAPGNIVLSDLNGDGVPDLIVANSGSNNLLIYLGLGGGHYDVTPRAIYTGTNPVGVTVANLIPGGPPDLIVANQGSNDVTVLFGQGTGADWTLTQGPRIQVGYGPVATVVKDVTGDGIPDLLVSDSQSNEVRMLKGLGNGFFNDANPTTYQTGTDPGPLFVANFTGRPGELDLVTLNAGSNDLSFFRNIGAGGDVVGQEIASGGIGPIAAVMGSFGGGGIDLLVANNGDGFLALFIGSYNGLTLSGAPFTELGLAHPTDLQLDPTTGQIFGASEGIDAALEISLGLGPGEGGGGGGGGFLPGGGSSVLTTGPGYQQLASLQPDGESALALLATILSVAIETTGEVPGLPNQPNAVENEIPSTGAKVVEDGAPPQSPDIASTLIGFLAGLDRSFDDAREAAREGSLFGWGPGRDSTAKRLEVLDSILKRWAPIVSMGGAMPTLATRLCQIGLTATRASLRLRLRSEATAFDHMGRMSMASTAGQWSIPFLAASIGHATLVRALADRRSSDPPRMPRRRSGTLRERD